MAGDVPGKRVPLVMEGRRTRRVRALMGLKLGVRATSAIAQKKCAFILALAPDSTS